MKILVACEESQAVTVRLRAAGHEAYSCDMLECSGGHPEWHLQEDVIPLLKHQWDAVIAFPPCTDLASSGAAHFARKKADGSQQRSIEFFMEFTKLDHVPIVVIENPIGIMSSLYRKPDQIVHPWQFGHMEQKSTCLWLKGVPPLQATDNVKEKMMKLPRNIRERMHYLPPSKDRARIRSKTYSGIAEAIVNQWFKETK
jgi:hypothetical protein